MAYTWEKIRKMKNVKCYYYHLWADDPGEGGLRLGLRKFHDYADDPLAKSPFGRWCALSKHPNGKGSASRTRL